jgi:hypothetical protein
MKNASDMAEIRRKSYKQIYKIKWNIVFSKGNTGTKTIKQGKLISTEMQKIKPLIILVTQMFQKLGQCTYVFLC